MTDYTPTDGIRFCIKVAILPTDGIKYYKLIDAIRGCHTTNRWHKILLMKYCASGQGPTLGSDTVQYR